MAWCGYYYGPDLRPKAPVIGHPKRDRSKTKAARTSRRRNRS